MDRQTATTFKMLAVGIAFGVIVGLVISYAPLPGDTPKVDVQPVAEDEEAPTPIPTPAVPINPPDERVPEPTDEAVLTFLTTGDTLYAATARLGISRTKDGEDWEPLRVGMRDPIVPQTLAQVLPTKETITAALAEAVGEDGGEPDLDKLKDALVGLAQQKPAILAGMSDGRVMRLNEQDNWDVLSRLPAAGGGVWKLRYHPSVGLAACTGRGLYFSEDGGAAWTQVTSDARTRDVIMSSDPNKRYLVALYGGGLTRCTAGGQCTPITGSPKDVRALEGLDANSAVHIATDGDGVWRLRGEKLEQLSPEGLYNADMHDMAVRGTRIVVAAGADGIWIRDRGDSGWHPARGLPPDAVTAVAIFKGRIYAGTRRYGILSSPVNDSDFTQAD
ncbi:MAG: hypothetical protein H6684_07740 [Deltaproteobacteria bacterium]|nr:hypothetical protein [bacterium]MCB9488605.1 hypothetical protein [Deltaproteobacteria bacterium]